MRKGVLRLGRASSKGPSEPQEHSTKHKCDKKSVAGTTLEQHNRLLKEHWNSVEQPEDQLIFTSLSMRMGGVLLPKASVR